MPCLSVVGHVENDDHQQQEGKQNDRDDGLSPSSCQKMFNQKQQNSQVERNPDRMGKDGEFYHS